MTTRSTDLQGKPAGSELSAGPTPRILIVDDRPENLLAIESTLDEMDVELVRAMSGSEALSLILRHEFALVLMDVQMPEMDGFEAAQLIRDNEATAQLPIIFVTAISKDERHMMRGYETGAVDYLFKPYNPRVLESKVRVFLDLYRKQRELKDALAALNASQEALEARSKEMHSFAHIAAHDLKAPLRRISSFSQILVEDYGDKLDDDARGYFDRIVTNARHMTQLVDDLLQYARSGKLDKPFETLDMKVLTEQVVKLLETVVEEAEATVEVDYLPLLRGDETSLKQLMQNLIANALKFRGEESPVVKVTAAEVDGRWQFSVSDNGIGIPEEHQEKVFGSFERLHSQTEFEGSGLGLATCKKLVEQHRGKIWLESTQGEGTTFHFTVGTACGEIGKLAPEDIGASGWSLEKPVMTIFNLDDDPGDALLLKSSIEGIQDINAVFLHEVDAAKTIMELGTNVYDVVFIDYQLDSATSGLDVVRELRQSGYDRPIVVCSGREDEALVTDFMDSGADVFLKKSEMSSHSVEQAIRVAEASQRHAH